MNTLYPTLWKSLRLVEGLEKIASADVVLSPTARHSASRVVDEIFGHVKRAAQRLPGDDDVGVKVASLMLEMRAAHAVTGEKLAVSAEVHADMLQKLATAVFVDAVLEQEAEKLAGDVQAHLRTVQSVGREYAVHLMNGLLS